MGMARKDVRERLSELVKRAPATASSPTRKPESAKLRPRKGAKSSRGTSPTTSRLPRR